MAKASGKLVADYLKLKNTKEYFEELSADMNIPLSALVKVSKGGSKEQGTWAHPDIAIDFAQWCSPKFKVWANRTLRKVIQDQPKTTKAITHYGDRVADIRKHLSKPQGYWCVIEKCNHLLLEVENSGYAINQFDLLDGSIGIRWSAYREELGLNNPVKKASYLMLHRRKQPVLISAFSNDELGAFSNWLETIYEKKHLLPYLQKTYGKLAKK